MIWIKGKMEINKHVQYIVIVIVVVIIVESHAPAINYVAEIMTDRQTDSSHNRLVRLVGRVSWCSEHTTQHIKNSP